MVKVLFLASNPEESSKLHLDEEIRSIREKIRASDYRDEISLIDLWAVRPDDLLQALNEHKPQIVHFSGHGDEVGEILLMDDNRNTSPVSAETLKDLFLTLKDNTRLVLLNACFSQIQAQEIARIIDCAVGMNYAIGDEAAIVFAASFYRALGFGRSVQNSFEQGITSLKLLNIPEEKTPNLFHKRGVNPASLYLTGPQAVRSEPQAEITRRASPEPPSINQPVRRAVKIAFDWVTIPAGRFLMGSDSEQDPDAEGPELPQHWVDLAEYQIARLPVTVAQFRRFVVAENHITTAEGLGEAGHLVDGDWVYVKGACWKHPHGRNSSVQEDHPVTCVSWEDAVAFCRWANVRLPTEAEWEKAASWDEAKKAKRKWPWGNTFDPNLCNSGEADIDDTTPVGLYSPRGDSAYGVSDMAGNVWEWCLDWYDANYYKYSPARNPQGPATGEQRVARGGSWFQKRQNVRCGIRFVHYPDGAVSDWGFRVCALKE